MALYYDSRLTMNITNGHIHFEDVDKLDETQEFLRELGVSKVAVVSAVKNDLLNSNPQALAFKAVAPDTTFIMGGFDYTGSAGNRSSAAGALVSQIERMYAIGFDGVKMLETKPSIAKYMPFAVDDGVYDGVYEFMVSHGLPVIWHVADPAQMWSKHDGDSGDAYARKMGWDYADGTFPAKETFYEQVENVLKRFPGLHVIFAHFYFLSSDLPRAARLLDEYPGVCLDITPGTEMYADFSRQRDEAREFFLAFRERIVYGDDLAVLMGKPIDRRGIREKVEFIHRFLVSDSTFRMPPGDEYFLQRDGDMHGLRLPADVLDLIYRRNFSRIVGKAPRPLNHELALQECERIAALLDARDAAAAGSQNFARRSSEILQHCETYSLHKKETPQ